LAEICCPIIARDKVLGVMTGGTLNNAKVNRIEPPGIISDETIDMIIARLDETLTDVAQEFSLNPGQPASADET
jgi:acetylornithine/succinyldiaminopimelate/putrescine aminotransferase